MKDNPSGPKDGAFPVQNVPWNEADEYCRAIDGRLPTEREWEYAARAGTVSARYAQLDAIAWYDDMSGGSRLRQVQLKQPNAFGLYDMLGNVWEWTSDSYEGQYRVIRGGSWDNHSENVRASDRDRLRDKIGDPGRKDNVGLRCVAIRH
jgi:formylglycine-generating enzyme required for sulfatase activity